MYQVDDSEAPDPHTLSDTNGHSATYAEPLPAILRDATSRQERQARSKPLPPLARRRHATAMVVLELRSTVSHRTVQGRGTTPGAGTFVRTPSRRSASFDGQAWVREGPPRSVKDSQRAHSNRTRLLPPLATLTNSTHSTRFSLSLPSSSPSFFIPSTATISLIPFARAHRRVGPYELVASERERGRGERKRRSQRRFGHEHRCQH